MILKTLKQKKGYITAKKMSVILGVSTKTIYKDIDLINECIGEYDIKIEKIPRKGIILKSNHKSERIDSILSDLDTKKDLDTYSVDFRNEYLFKEVLLNRKKIMISEYEDRFFISEGSSRRDISKFDIQISKFNLELVRDKGRVFIKGDEYKIRNAAKRHLYTLIDNANIEDIETLARFFDKKIIMNCKRVIDELGEKYDFKLSGKYFNTLLIDLLVQIKMIQLGFILKEHKKSLIFDINHFEVYFYAREILQKIITPREEIQSQEIESLSFTLLAVGFKNNNIGYGSRLDKSITEFITKVSEILEINLTHDSHLKDMLISHIGPMIIRLQQSIFINNPVVEEIKKQYSVLYNVIWLCVREITEEFNIKMTADEAAFLAIHFQIAIEKVQKSITILVICPHGISTSELIISKIRKIVSYTDKIIKVDLEDLEKIDLKKIDFAVSSIKLKKINIPVFEVSPVITDEEMKSISSFYINEMDKNKLANFRIKTETDKNLIKELLGENILLKSSAKNKSEIFNEFSKIANDKNLENPDFLESIIKRESLGSTSIYTGISIPHSDPKYVNRSQFGIITLDKPIEWNNNLVKVVLLIAIADKDIDSVKNVLINIYRRIENKNFIDELWKSQTKKDLIYTFIDWRENNARE